MSCRILVQICIHNRSDIPSNSTSRELSSESSCQSVTVEMFFGIGVEILLRMYQLKDVFGAEHPDIHVTRKFATRSSRILHPLEPESGHGLIPHCRVQISQDRQIATYGNEPRSAAE